MSLNPKAAHDAMENPLDYLTATNPPVQHNVNPDTIDSWVMLNQSGFVKLANERILMSLESRISCELSVSQELKARCTAFQRKSDKGALYLTNKRIVYLPAKPAGDPLFESFSAPILNFQDSSTSSSMWWGWSWKSDCIPVSGGGVPPDVPRIEVKFTFSDGGMMDFNESYIRLRERLFQLREMRREMGSGADIPDEPLPLYEAQAANLVNDTPMAPEQHHPSSSGNPRNPDEPPPAYDEAQAQHIHMRLEDHIREGADRNY